MFLKLNEELSLKEENVHWKPNKEKKQINENTKQKEEDKIWNQIGLSEKSLKLRVKKYYN